MKERPDHWGCVVNRYCFVKIPEQQVSTDIIRRAKAVANFVCEELKMPRLKIVRFRPADPADVAAKLGSLRVDVQLPTAREES
jgi:hypothetical protein